MRNANSASITSPSHWPCGDILVPTCGDVWVPSSLGKLGFVCLNLCWLSVLPLLSSAHDRRRWGWWAVADDPVFFFLAKLLPEFPWSSIHASGPEVAVANILVGSVVDGDSSSLTA